METTETYTKIPPGEYEFTVAETPTKKLTANGKPMYVFTFLANMGEYMKKHTERIPAFMAGDLLRALGCNEIKPGVFQWEKSEVKGKTVKATIVYEPDRNDATKSWPRMKEIRPALTPVEQPPVENGNSEQIPF